jgi:hypothetical protein
MNATRDHSLAIEVIFLLSNIPASKDGSSIVDSVLGRAADEDQQKYVFAAGRTSPEKRLAPYLSVTPAPRQVQRRRRFLGPW